MINISVDDLKTGGFLLYENPKDKFSDQIEQEQLRKKFSPKDAKWTHVDVLGPQMWAVRVSPPSSKVVNVFQHYRGRRACLVMYKADDIEKKRQYIAWWAANHLNVRYDYLGVLKFKIKWIWHKKDRWFCSENAAWALQKEYPHAMNALAPHLCMPAHFRDERWFEIIKEGTIF